MKIGGVAYRDGGSDPLWMDDFRWSFSVPNAAFFGPTAGRIFQGCPIRNFA